MYKTTKRVTITLAIILLLQNMILLNVNASTGTNQNNSNVYQASADDNATQGYRNWYYMEKSAAGYKEMTYDTASHCWKGSAACCQINGGWQHPDVNDSVRKWVAPYSGSIMVTSNGNIRKSDIGGGDGVIARLVKNSNLLWETKISWNDGVGVNFPARVIEVNAGDALYFEINQNGNRNYDSTIWDPTIEYKEIPAYQASADDNATQGYRNWYYMEKSAAGYKEMTYDAANHCWKGSTANCMINGGWQHPDVNDSVRKWVAPYSGSIMVTSNGNIRKGNTGGGDGVIARLAKNGNLLWETQVSWNDGVGVNFPVRVIEVNAGDALYFEINQNGNISYDSTIWDPVVEYREVPQIGKNLVLNCSQNKDVNLALSGSNINSSNKNIFTIRYRTCDLEVVDLCAVTSVRELSVCSISSAKIEIIDFNSNIGLIRLKVNQTIQKGTSWSGTFNIIKFRCKKASGTTEISY
jgi:hypothetical protein